MKKITSEEELIELLNSGFYIESRSVAASVAAGTYFIPGIGQVLVLGNGFVVIGGVTIYAGHWDYNAIKNWFNNPKASASRAYGIPQKLLDRNGNVKLGSFNQKLEEKAHGVILKQDILKKKFTRTMEAKNEISEIKVEKELLPLMETEKYYPSKEHSYEKK